MKIDWSGLDNNQLVNAIRVCIGLDPLYGPPKSTHEACGRYVHLEFLARAADPSCDHCGGSGYFDGELLEMRCECTGLAQRTAHGGRLPGTGDPGFGYRGRSYTR